MNNRDIYGIDTEDKGIGPDGIISIQVWGANVREYFKRGDESAKKFVSKFWKWVRKNLGENAEFWAVNAAYDAVNLRLISAGVSAKKTARGYTEFRHDKLMPGCVLFDTLSITPASLAMLGSAIGLDKLEFAPDSEEYAMRDAEIVYKWVNMFKAGLAGLGENTSMRATAGSTASALWRAMGGETARLPSSLQDAGREAYRGGRTEVFRVGNTECKGQIWDISSAYPAAMISDKGFPAGDWQPSRTIELPGIYDVTIRVTGEYGAVPARGQFGDSDSFVCYPVGTFRGIYVSDDLLVPGVEVLEIHEGWAGSEIVYPFDDYIQELYSIKQGDKGPVQVAAKVLLNSLYGILGQTGKVAGLATIKEGCRLEGHIVAPNVISYRSDRGPPKSSNVIWAAMITARVRAQLYQAILDTSDRVVYCDTDSVFLTGRSGNKPSPIGRRLGAWDLQEDVEDISVTVPKVYSFKSVSGEMKYKAKGVSGRAKKDFVTFGRAEWEAPFSLIEAAVQKDTPNRWRTVGRELRTSYRARYVYEDGTTRPWDVDADGIAIL